MPTWPTGRRGDEVGAAHADCGVIAVPLDRVVGRGEGGDERGVLLRADTAG